MSWQAFGASVQGVGHKRLKLPCQDACHWQVLPSGGVICAVADGLGSSAKAEVGAEIVITVVVAELNQSLPTLEEQPSEEAIAKILCAAVQSARSALEQRATDCSVPLHEFATTLLVACSTDTWSGIAQIGDGAIVGYWRDGRLECLSLPQHGEYINETIPLTADNALSRLDVKSWQAPLAALALFSDGLQSLAINLQQGSPHPPFFTPFFTALQQPLNSEAISKQLAAFLDSERVCSRTDDDKTLVIAGYIAV